MMARLASWVALTAAAVTLGASSAAAAASAGHLTTPSPQQLTHMSWELEMFVHFSITTYTGSQAGNQDPAKFAPDPATLNVSQWVATAKSMGAKVAVLTSKHEAGFCLWPSKFSNYTIAQSSTVPHRDLVREFVDACREQDVVPGLYFTFGAHETGMANASEIQLAQMGELTSNYGPILYWWFDHHSNDPTHVAIDNMVRKAFPQAVMLGPDSWLTGGESGFADYPLWYAVNTTDGTDHARPNTTLAPGDGGGFPYGAQFKSWESDCSFFNDCHPWYCCGTVQSPETALAHWEATWGRGTNYILNLPPSKSGLIEPNLVAAAAEFGRNRKSRYTTPVANATGPATAPIVVPLPAGAGARRVLLSEVTLPTVGQLVANYTIEAQAGAGGPWHAVDLGPAACPSATPGRCGGKTVGVRHLDTFDPPLGADTAIRVTVTGTAECKACPPAVLSVSVF